MTELLFWFCLATSGLLVVMALSAIVHDRGVRVAGRRETVQGAQRMLWIILILLGILGVLVALYARAASIELALGQEDFDEQSHG